MVQSRLYNVNSADKQGLTTKILNERLMYRYIQHALANLQWIHINNHTIKSSSASDSFTNSNAMQLFQNFKETSIMITWNNYINAHAKLIVNMIHCWLIIKSNKRFFHKNQSTRYNTESLQHLHGPVHMWVELFSNINQYPVRFYQL